VFPSIPGVVRFQNNKPGEEEYTIVNVSEIGDIIKGLAERPGAVS